MTKVGNRLGVWLYRRSNGRLSSATKDVRVLMLTAPGRRTGLPRTTCMSFLESDGKYVVWGTGSGSSTDPDWFRNLRNASAAEVQIGARRLSVRPRELHGAERDAVWDGLILKQLPGVAKYARRAGRTIPVAELEPFTERGEPMT
jgi:deazaflavin-dependent oxidoreductase (nitroreductase family)